MIPIVSSIAGLLSTIFKGVFGFKKDQADTVQTALKTFNAVTNSEQAYFAASAASIASVYEKGSFLEKNWRPSLMWVCIGLIIARWFGYSPPGLTPEEITHLYTFIYIGLGGYIPLRSIDKWMQGFQIGAILKTFIQKKVL